VFRDEASHRSAIHQRAVSSSSGHNSHPAVDLRSATIAALTASTSDMTGPASFAPYPSLREPNRTACLALSSAAARYAVLAMRHQRFRHWTHDGPPRTAIVFFVEFVHPLYSQLFSLRTDRTLIRRANHVARHRHLGLRRPIGPSCQTCGLPLCRFCSPLLQADDVRRSEPTPATSPRHCWVQSASIFFG
jgi:hypothetical protein